MRIPIDWIHEFAPVDLEPHEVVERLTMAGLEVETCEVTEAGTVLDIKVTPNRGDCLSVLGVARELAAACGTAFLGPSKCPSSLDEPPDAAMFAGVSIECPDLCPRYAARVVEDIRVGPSPDWMQRRLIAAGMRPISNIVDITNYVMLETGQPLHAFDYDTLHERRIVVRTARDGEHLTTLDGVTRPLEPGMLVIADADRPVALAGVMGGADTEITESTRTMLLESAHFLWRSIRRTARSLGLDTEASYRFERFVDPEGVVYAADLACKLISDLEAGRPVAGVVDEYPGRQPLRELRLRMSRCSLLTGYPVSRDEAVAALERLGFKTRVCSEDELSVLTPSWRSDIAREVDLVEEVARVLGYERIPERLISGTAQIGRDSDEGAFREEVRNVLVGIGLQEVQCHGLVAPSALDGWIEPRSRLAIRNASSAEVSGLRRSMLPGLCQVADWNARRGLGPLAFFEVGPVFGGLSETEHIEETRCGGFVAGPLTAPSWHRARTGSPAFYVAKGIVERLLATWDVAARFEPSSDPRLHPSRQAYVVLGEERIGLVGELHPDLQADLRIRERCGVFELALEPIRRAARAVQRIERPISRFPAVRRDLAPRLPLNIAYQRVLDAVRTGAGPILAEVALTDVYSGPPLPEGWRSFTMALTFQVTERTLTDAEVDAAMAAIRNRLSSELGATFQEAG